MKSLSELPEEILSLIFAGNSSFLVIDIWKCGDVVMNYKLTRCIYTITLKDRRSCSTSRWPKCLTAFTRLRSLSLCKAGPAVSASMTLMAEILKLPPTLECLELDTYNEFWQIPRSCETEKRAAERINYASYLALMSSLNGKTPFPRLNQALLSEPSLRPPLSPLLPMLLSNVTILTGDLQIHRLADFSQLETVKGSVTIESGITPPPLLKHIDRVTVKAADYHEWTSRGITSNSLGLGGILTADLALVLPATLTSLKLEYVDEASIKPSYAIWTEILPRTLEAIHFGARLLLNDLHISKLPRSITSLSGSVKYVSEDAMNGIVMDLPNLKEWSTSPPQHPLIINKLPPSVTEFSMNFPTESSSDFPLKLPEQLKSFNPVHWPLPFPTSLSTLKHLESCYGPISPQHLQSLPSSITRIYFNDRDWTDRDFETLFTISGTHLTSLVSLSIEGWHAAHLDTLPQTITILGLYSLKGMDMKLISFQFAHLPPRLQSLSITTNSRVSPYQLSELSHINIKRIWINHVDPRLGKVSNFDAALCYPDLRISKLPYPENFFKSESIHDAMPTDALNHPFWSHLDNQNQNPNLNLKSILPSHWLPSIVDVANAIDCCMIEVDDTIRHSMMQLATQPRLTEWTQSQLSELCLTPHWTVRKLGIAICLLDHENSVAFAKLQPHSITTYLGNLSTFVPSCTIQ